MREFDLFLKLLMVRIELSARQRREIERELRDHLDERYERLMGQGWSHDRAVRTALEDVGDIVHLAGQLTEAGRLQQRRTWIMRSVRGGCAAAACVLAAMFLLPAGRPSAESTARQTAWTGQAGASLLGVVDYTAAALRSIGAVAATADAQQVPQVINHQGVIAVNGTRFTGTGDFRFAVIDPQDGSKNRWTNDGSQLGVATIPDSGVLVAVTDGNYSVRLGDAAAGMVALSSTVFADTGLSLRIWFTDGVNGIQHLTPDHPLSSSPYAMLAATVADAAITTTKLSDNAVTADKLGNNAVSSTKLASDAASFSRVTGGLASGGGTTLHLGNPTPITQLQISSSDNAGYGQFLHAFIPSLSSGNRALMVFGKNLASYQSGWISYGYNSITAISAIGIGHYGEAEGMVIQPGARVGIGTAPDGGYNLHVAGPIKCTSLTQTSSREMKNQIRSLTVTDAVNTLNRLDPVRYRYRTDALNDEHIGFIAEDVPELVATPDRKGLSAMDIVAVLTKVVQEQQNTMDRQARELQQMQAEMAELKVKIGE